MTAFKGLHEDPKIIFKSPMPRMLSELRQDDMSRYISVERITMPSTHQVAEGGSGQRLHSPTRRNRKLGTACAAEQHCLISSDCAMNAKTFCCAKDGSQDGDNSDSS